MGRASRKDKGKKTGKAKAKKDDGEPSSMEGLIEQAEACAGQYDYDGALQYYEKALQINSDHPPLLDAVGELLLEMGEHEKAKAVLVRSVQLAPEGSFATYMYLGQLLTGTDAVACFDRGATLILKEIESQEDPIAKQTLKRRLSSSMCARGEVFMTDLCDEAQAEAECERSLTSAVEHDDSNSEAWVTKANFHICQQNAPTALSCLDKACSIVEAIEDDAELPSFEVRLNIGKMYVELAEHAKVTAVLEDLLAEDDEHIEILFMLSTSYKELNEIGSAQECIERAVRLYEKLPTKERNSVVEGKIRELVAQLQQAGQ